MRQDVEVREEALWLSAPAAAHRRRSPLRNGWVDLSGAHLGATSLLTGANLAAARFLMQQLDSARGDEDTKLPAGRQRPAHWSAGPAAVD